MAAWSYGINLTGSQNNTLQSSASCKACTYIGIVKHISQWPCHTHNEVQITAVASQLACILRDRLNAPLSLSQSGCYAQG